MDVKKLESVAEVDGIYVLDPNKTYVLQFKHNLSAKQYELIQEIIQSQFTQPTSGGVVVIGHQVKVRELVEGSVPGEQTAAL